MLSLTSVSNKNLLKQALVVMALQEEIRQTYQHSLFAILNPPPGGKIGRLRTIEDMVKAGMVTIRESDHKLSRFLSHLNKSRLEAAASHGRSLQNWNSELQLCHNLAEQPS